MLRFLKSVLAGSVAVVASAVLLVVDAFLTVRIRAGGPSGVGRVAIRIGPGTMLTALVIFVAAFLWQLRRGRPED